MMVKTTKVAIAYVATATLVVTAIAACGDTPPVSPVNASTTALPPAHASPDPPPARPIIVEDAGLGAGRSDAGAFDVDAGATDPDAGMNGANGANAALGGNGADGGAGASSLSAAWQAPIGGADAKIAALRPTLRACYTRSINGKPQGRVLLHASIAADGSVQSVTAGDTQGVTGRVVACMIDVLKAAQLPAPGRATTLDVPVSFQTP